MEQDNTFSVVGAYDTDGKDYDMNYGQNAEERSKAEENIKQVKVPRIDPVVGDNGGVIQHWKNGCYHRET
ncbi:unnamed protein product [Rotaria socialis]